MDLPLFALNLRIWRALGYVEREKHARAILLLCFPLLANIFQFCNIFLHWHNFNHLAIGLFMTVITFNSLLRVFSVWLKDAQFKRLLAEVAAWHKEMKRTNDSTTWRILSDTYDRSMWFSKFSLAASVFGGALTVLMAYLMPQRALPHALYVPFFDIMQSPYYELAFLLESVWLMPFICTSYTPYLNIFITMLLFGIATMQHLRHKLSLLAKCRNKQEMEEQLHICLAYHNRIIRYCHDLEQFMSFVGFMELAMFSVMLCVLLVFFVLNESFILKFTAAVYILSILYALFLPYWFTNELAEQSLLIADAAYDTDWFEGSKDFRTCILIMIERSQIALQLKVGGMYPMSMQTFQKLLNSSYSAFTLLTNLNRN